MKKILISILMISGINAAGATVSDVFIGSDVNELKAGEDKYFKIKGENGNHTNYYKENNIQEIEKRPKGA